MDVGRFSQSLGEGGWWWPVDCGSGPILRIWGFRFESKFLGLEGSEGFVLCAVSFCKTVIEVYIHLGRPLRMARLWASFLTCFCHLSRNHIFLQDVQVLGIVSFLFVKPCHKISTSRATGIGSCLISDVEGSEVTLVTHLPCFVFAGASVLERWQMRLDARE